MCLLFPNLKHEEVSFAQEALGVGIQGNHETFDFCRG